MNAVRERYETPWKRRVRTTWKRCENGAKTVWERRKRYVRERRESGVETAWEWRGNGVRMAWKRCENGAKTACDSCRNLYETSLKPFLHFYFSKQYSKYLRYLPKRDRDNSWIIRFRYYANRDYFILIFFYDFSVRLMQDWYKINERPVKTVQDCNYSKVEFSKKSETHKGNNVALLCQRHILYGIWRRRFDTLYRYY